MSDTPHEKTFELPDDGLYIRAIPKDHTRHPEWNIDLWDARGGTCLLAVRAYRLAGGGGTDILAGPSLEGGSRQRRSERAVSAAAYLGSTMARAVHNLSIVTLDINAGAGPDPLALHVLQELSYSETAPTIQEPGARTLDLYASVEDVRRKLQHTFPPHFTLA